MSASHSHQTVPDTELGLTQGEIQILRHQQQVMAQRSHQDAISRGRGTSRQSQPSSRHVSAASSQGPPNRVVLDPRQLQALQAHLDNVERAIAGRIDDLERATQDSVNTSSSRHGQAVVSAETQIKRMRDIIAKIDDLEADCRRIKHIKEAIKRLRARIDSTSDRLDRSAPSGSHHHSHHSSDRHRR